MTQSRIPSFECSSGVLLGQSVFSHIEEIVRPTIIIADRRDSKPGTPVFNRTVTLRDEWAKLVSTGRENK